MIVVATLAYETHTGIDVDLETYLPLLIPMGLGGLLKHGLDVGAGRRRANGAGGGANGAFYQPPPPREPAPQDFGAAMRPGPDRAPAQAAPEPALTKTDLNNAVQRAVAQALKQSRR